MKCNPSNKQSRLGRARGANRRAARRSGQALLLAVLLMVFAAILGATFVTIVSLNLTQTARSGSKGESINAAQAGLQYVDDRLVSQGLSWKPTDDVRLPTSIESSYSFYYDEFDRAQGWAAEKFVKFPDPRAESGGTSANFMVQVKKVLVSDPDNTDGSKTGALRVTVIGRATDNAAAFTRLVRYKAGPSQNAIGGAMRTITNWDFVSGEVPHGEVASFDGNSVTLKNVRGTFPLKGDSDNYNGYSVMIGDPNTGIAPRAMTVQSWDAANKRLTFTQNFAGPPIISLPAVGERVEMAATLGAPSFINYDNNSSITGTPAELASFAVGGTTGNAVDPAAVGGVRVNGGVLWLGNVKAALVSPDSAPVFSKVQTSGLQQIYNNATLVKSPATGKTETGLISSSVVLSGTYHSGTNQTLTNAALDKSSSDNSFPGNWTGSSGPLTPTEKAQLVDDGWNRLAGNPTTTRSVVPFTAPMIDPTHWRGLTRDSKPASGYNQITAARWGYGKGTYIDNRDDRERVSSGGVSRDMTEAEFRQMLFDNGVTAVWNRLGTPASETDTTKTLEERHLRGWVGSEEFRARGVLLEINNTTITITRDSRDDASVSALPTSKAWRDANGALLGDTAKGGVFTQTLQWPENGTIFAEGNVRVRGISTATPRSLTIVSMGNIFIEGSTSLQAASGHKLLLMARKNVVLNPTQQISQVDVQTLLTQPITTSTNTISVADATVFQIGDWITIEDPNPLVNTEAIVCITDVNTANNVLTLDRAASAASVGQVVQAKGDPPIATADQIQLARFGQVVQRRFRVPSNANVRLALKHSGERREALAIRYKKPVTGSLQPEPASAILGFKLASSSNSSIITKTDKKMVIDLGVAPPTPDPDTFEIPITLPSGATTANDYSLRWLGGDINGTPTPGELRSRRLSPKWRYADNSDANILGNYLSPSRTPPFFFLAAVGNRYRQHINTTGLDSKAIAPIGSAATFREPLKNGWDNDPLKTQYEIPLATSVAFRMNDKLASEPLNSPADTEFGIVNDPVNGGSFQSVGQFGFNPRHGAEDDKTAPEDVTTVDQSFYTNSPDSSASEYTQTLDSRVMRNVKLGANTMSFRFSETGPDGGDLDAFFSATAPLATMPYYRLHRLKFENATPFNGVNYETLAPAVAIDVNAFVYAQNGSWLIVPGSFFDEDAVNYNTVGYSQKNDLNRDGVISRGERIAAFRFHRYNYQINFFGTICENRTAPVFDSGTGATAAKGLVSQWMDKWTTVTTKAANWQSADDKYFSTGASAVSFNNGNINNINYSFDPALAAGNLDNDEAFRLPVEPGWLGEQ